MGRPARGAPPCPLPPPATAFDARALSALRAELRAERERADALLHWSDDRDERLAAIRALLCAAADDGPASPVSTAAKA
eukprot:gene4373-32345_t